jgi:hypothetical protein
VQPQGADTFAGRVNCRAGNDYHLTRCKRFETLDRNRIAVNLDSKREDTGTDPRSFSPAFLLSLGGTALDAEMALVEGLAARQAYFDIHTKAFRSVRSADS